jgi:hypothetical protein
VSLQPIFQDQDLVSFFLIIQPAMLATSILGDYSTRVSSTPSYFLHRFDLLENLVSDRSVLNLATSANF